MAGSSARSFQVGMDEADLNRCKVAGVNPAELVRESVRDALAALIDAPEDEEDEEEPVEEEAQEDEDEEETEDVEAPSYSR